MSGKIKIFVTVGSQKFTFDRLLRKINSIALMDDHIEVFAQTGCSQYIPDALSSSSFIDRDEFSQRMKWADVIVTHAGTGAIIGALKSGKKVVAVPRRSAFGEHVDDHQVEIVKQFAELHLIEPCYEIDYLEDAIKAAVDGEYAAYKSNRDVFIDDLRNSIERMLNVDK